MTQHGLSSRNKRPSKLDGLGDRLREVRLLWRFIMNTLSETRIIHPRETTSFPDLSYGSPPREGGGEDECYLVVACRTVSEDKTKYEKSYWTQKRTCPEYDMNLLWNARKILTEFEKVRFPSVVCGLRFRIPTNVLECWQYGYHGKLAGSVSYFV